MSFPEAPVFTGIIEEKGRVESLSVSGTSCRISIFCPKIFSGIKTGDSVAVNGVCLTAALFPREGVFAADVMPETLRRSNLGQLRSGSMVNLERALPAQGRFGGHIVAGHIDGTGKIVSSRPEGNAVLVTVSVSPELSRYIVEKGSVAVDGISLTVAKVSKSDFTVSLIPHTAGETTLLERNPGDMVNLETDIIGKYVEKFLRPDSGGLTETLLKENGFF